MTESIIKESQSTTPMSFIKKIFLGIIFFMYFYNPPLFYFGIPVSASKIIILLSLGYFIIYPKTFLYFLQNKKYVAFIISTVIVAFSIFFISNIVHIPNGDNEYVKSVLFYIPELLVCSFFMISMTKEGSFIELIDFLIAIALLQSIIMIIAILSPTLKKLIFDIKDADPYSGLYSKWGWDEYEFRGLAIAADSRLGLSIFHATVCACVLWKYYFMEKISWVFKIKSAITFIIIAIGGILGARTFFVAFIIYIAIILLIFNGRGLLKILRLILYSGVIIYLLYLLLSPIVLSSEKNRVIMHELTSWAFEFINAYTAHGTIETGSSDDLFENHLKVYPERGIDWLIGDENRHTTFGRQSVRLKTDSGYLLLIFYMGIVGSVILYLFWAFLLGHIFFLYKRRSSYRSFAYIILAFSIVIFLGQIKTDFIPGSYLFLKIPILFWVYIIEKINCKHE